MEMLLGWAGILWPNLIQNAGSLSSVSWIYWILVLIATMRIWLSLRITFTPCADRLSQLDRWHVFSELTVNLPVLFGVMGTLIGVSEAVAAKFQSGGTDPGVFMQAFSASFSDAITTTIAGAVVHAICFLLSSYDHLIAERNCTNKSHPQSEPPVCQEED